MVQNILARGKTSAGAEHSVLVNSDGKVYVIIDGTDLEIGAMEIKDATTDTRLIVNSDGSINTSFGALSSTTDSISVPAPTAITDGNKTVTTAGTAVRLVASTTASREVTITALLANTGLISVGGSTTTPSGTVRGVILAAGDSYTIAINDLYKVYINSTVNSEGVSFTATA
jgi:hypothetical protein